MMSERGLTIQGQQGLISGIAMPAVVPARMNIAGSR
jgi:hypothetical protein